MKKFNFKMIGFSGLVLLGVVAVLLLVPEARSPQKIAYLKKTYPLAPADELGDDFFDELNFYWYDPSSTAFAFKQVAKTLSPKQDPNYVCLSYMKSCEPLGPNSAVVKNTYHDGRASNAPEPTPNNQLVEVYHNGWGVEPGSYYYAISGTGVFLNVGRSLVALNKFDALHQLGLSDKAIFSYSAIYTKNGRPAHSFALIKQWADDHNVTFMRALQSIMRSARVGDNYANNRLATTESADFILYQLARQKGYQTVQLRSQPNINGGWAYEILDVRVPLTATLKEKWEKNKAFLFIANPLNLKKRAPCQYDTPFHILRCRSPHPSKQIKPKK